MAMLTGRENTLLLGVLAGMTPAGRGRRSTAVKEASGLGTHYDHLVASYSQGMRARLGLAVMERTEPAILLLDEIHEALDHEFRDHVEGYARELLGRGGIVIATGHDHPHARALLQPRAVARHGELESPTATSTSAAPLPRGAASVRPSPARMPACSRPRARRRGVAWTLLRPRASLAEPDGRRRPARRSGRRGASSRRLGLDAVSWPCPSPGRTSTLALDDDGPGASSGCTCRRAADRGRRASGQRVLADAVPTARCGAPEPPGCLWILLLRALVDKGELAERHRPPSGGSRRPGGGGPPELLEALAAPSRARPDAARRRGRRRRLAGPASPSPSTARRRRGGCRLASPRSPPSCGAAVRPGAHRGGARPGRRRARRRWSRGSRASLPLPTRIQYMGLTGGKLPRADAAARARARVRRAGGDPLGRATRAAPSTALRGRIVLFDRYTLDGAVPSGGAERGRPALPPPAAVVVPAAGPRGRPRRVRRDDARAQGGVRPGGARAWRAAYARLRARGAGSWSSTPSSPWSAYARRRRRRSGGATPSCAMGGRRERRRGSRSGSRPAAGRRRSRAASPGCSRRPRRRSRWSSSTRRRRRRGARAASRTGRRPLPRAGAPRAVGVAQPGARASARATCSRSPTTTACPIRAGWPGSSARSLARPRPAAASGPILPPLGEQPPGTYAISLRRVRGAGRPRGPRRCRGARAAARTSPRRVAAPARSAAGTSASAAGSPGQAAEDADLLYRLLRGGGPCATSPRRSSATSGSPARGGSPRAGPTRYGVGAMCGLWLGARRRVRRADARGYARLHLRPLLGALRRRDRAALARARPRARGLGAGRRLRPARRPAGEGSGASSRCRSTRRC